MTEERSVDRFVVFIDAVVAIAITLLVLPLAGVPRTGGGDPLHGLGAQLSLDSGPFVGFAVSFFVIGRSWWAHHQAFAPVRRWSPPLVRLSFLWLFTIVLLPAVTAFSFSYSPRRSPVPVLLYVGTMLVSSLLLTALSAIAHRDRAVAPDGGDVASRNRLIGTTATSIAFAVALVLGTLIPVLNFWALLTIPLTGPFEALVRRHYARRGPSVGSATMEGSEQQRS